MSDNGKWESWSYTEKTGWGTRTVSGRTKKQKQEKKTTYEEVVAVLQQHEHRCLDDQADMSAVAHAVTKFIKSM